MNATRLRLSLLAAAAAVVLVSCGSNYSSGTGTTAAAGGAAGTTATTASGATTTVDSYGYGGGYGAPPTTTAGATTSVATSGGGTSVALASVGKFGQSVVDAKGMSLYMFANDKDGKSACNAGCATAWPPATVTATPTAGPGLDASKLSTLTRDDGKTQLVYNGHPLYTFAGDAAPGQAGGQGSGGIWFLVNAAGDKIPA